MKHTIKILSAMAIIATMVSCGGNEGEETTKTTTDTASAKNANTETARIVLESVPSPVETAEILKDAGATYDPALLNDPNNASKYSTQVAQALNLGVYGTDLSFTTIFDQPQESRYYLKSTAKLAKALSIDEAFKQMSEDRVERNIDSRDSLLEMVNDAFWEADERLKAQQRPSYSALIVTGGWIEGMYIASKLASQTKNQALATRIAEQKRSLASLLQLLENYKSDPDVQGFITALKELETLFGEVKIENTLEAKTDSEKKETEIGGSSSVEFSAEQLKKITGKIETIRGNIVGMN